MARSYTLELGTVKRIDPPTPHVNHEWTANGGSQRSLAPPSPSQRMTTDAAGLSKPHTITNIVAHTSQPRDETYQVTYYEGAALVDIQGPRSSATPPSGGLRKEIKGMSNGSRSRLTQSLAKVTNSARENGLAVCLTYPRDVVKPEEWEIYKNHLRVFNQAVKRHYPGASGIWVLEFHKSGAPHFHLLVFGLKGKWELDGIREWMQRRWYDIAHAGDVHQGKAGTNIDWVKSGGGVMGYMAKYMSKGHQGNKGTFTGRMWGKFGELPLGDMKTLNLSYKEVVRARRWARKKMEVDVNNARWNNFLSNRNPKPGAFKNPWAFGPRMFWEKLISAYHSGARCVTWTYWREAERYEDTRSERQLITSYSSVKSLYDCYKPPTKWRAKSNDRIRLICNADKFVTAIT